MVKSIQQNSKYDIMVKSHQKFKQGGETKNSKKFPSKGLLGSQNLETIPKFILWLIKIGSLIQQGFPVYYLSFGRNFYIYSCLYVSNNFTQFPWLLIGWVKRVLIILQKSLFFEFMPSYPACPKSKFLQGCKLIFVLALFLR